MLRFPDRDLPPGHPDRRALAGVAERFGVPVGGVALATSMPDYVDAALSIRPEVRDAVRQAVLTERHLLPAVPALEALFLRLRAGVDPGLRRLRPGVGGRAYPVGQCLEITRAVLGRLDSLDGDAQPPLAAAGRRALLEFRDAGGQVRIAWGDLRGAYFQNALLVGTLYVDVANDTVVVTKPPVEIMPLADADFRPIADHRHFARIASSYWKHHILPNHVAPEIAAYAPIIQVSPGGAMRFGPMSAHMLGLTLAGRFRSSEAALAAAPLPLGLFQQVAGAIGGSALQVAPDPETGRRAALEACRAARRRGDFDCPGSFNRAVAAVHDLNRRLAGDRNLAQPAA